MFSAFGGLDQIRTGVRGFADRCLAARPRDPVFISTTQRYVKIDFMQILRTFF